VLVVAGAVGRGPAAAAGRLEEAEADAGGLQPVDGVDVGVALAGVGQRAARVVVVEAVAPLVVEHGRDLAGVPAAAAGAVEVHGAAIPEGVAGVVDVHVGGQPAAQPGVVGQPAAGLLGQLVDLVESRAGGGRVAGPAAGAHRAVVLVV